MLAMQALCLLPQPASPCFIASNSFHPHHKPTMWVCLLHASLTDKAMCAQASLSEDAARKWQRWDLNPAICLLCDTPLHSGFHLAFSFPAVGPYLSLPFLHYIATSASDLRCPAGRLEVVELGVGQPGVDTSAESSFGSASKHYSSHPQPLLLPGL